MEKKKWWVVAFAVAGVAIVGLIIAIVIVVVNRNGASSEQTSMTTEGQQDAIDAAIEAQYEAENNEIMSKFVLGEGVTIEDLVVMYKEKMDTATDEKLRAMFAVDYYMYLSILDLNGEKKDEILNALIEADDILKNLNSASAIITVAEGYSDQDLMDRYESILQDRATEIDVENLENTDDTNVDENTDDGGGVGVYGTAKMV